MSRPSAPLLLALDTGSPRVSVALARGGRLLAERSLAQERSSAGLLPAIEEILAEAGATPRDLGGILALRGPGSFTGLRVGLATAYGLHQALGLPATGLSTLAVLAHAAGEQPGRVAGVVDALRGEWFVQDAPSETPDPPGEARILPAAALPSLAPATLVGFGIGRAVATLGSAAQGLRTIEPPPLAGVALAFAAAGTVEWDASLLTRPLYLRAPAVTPPASRASARRAPAAG